MNRQRIGKRPSRRLVHRPRLEASHTIGAKVADPVVEQGQHAVRLERQDVDAGMQFALKAQ